MWRKIEPARQGRTRGGPVHRTKRTEHHDLTTPDHRQRVTGHIFGTPGDYTRGSRVKRPAFQFYPADWLNDLALRQCSAVARAVWIDMLAVMHEGEPYGHLQTVAGAIALPWLASKAGVTGKQLTDVIAELERHQVFSRTNRGIIYSRRMVRDEAIRNARAAGGHKSEENPNVPRQRG